MIARASCRAARGAPRAADHADDPGPRPLVPMNPEDVVAPDIIFRPIGAFPELRAAPEKITLHSLTKPTAMATQPRMPTVIHMYDSG